MRPTLPYLGTETLWVYSRYPDSASFSRYVSPGFRCAIDLRMPVFFGPGTLRRAFRAGLLACLRLTEVLLSFRSVSEVALGAFPLRRILPRLTGTLEEVLPGFRCVIDLLAPAFSGPGAFRRASCTGLLACLRVAEVIRGCRTVREVALAAFLGRRYKVICVLNGLAPLRSHGRHLRAASARTECFEECIVYSFAPKGCFRRPTGCVAARDMFG